MVDGKDKGSENSKNGKGKFRQLSGVTAWFSRFLAVGLSVFAFLFIMNFFIHIGVFIYGGAYNAIFLAIVLTLIFLLKPASKNAPTNKVPWYDFVLLIIGNIGVLYIAIVYEDLLIRGGIGITVFQQILGCLTILVLIEAVRRMFGWAMIIIAFFFLVHAKFTYLFPGAFSGPHYSLARILNFVYLSNNGIFGMLLGIASTLIITFMIFGAFLQVTGAGEMFIKLSMALMGHVRGGPAKVAVIASAFFGTLTGSPVANVGITGSITIPLMKRIGYNSAFAGAVEAAASTGGVIMPPVMGAVAFVMADFTGVGYAKIAIAAIIPAILYFLALYFQLDLRAAAKGLVGIPKSEVPTLKEALGGNWVLFIPLVLLILLLMVFQYEPMQAVFYSLGVLLVFTLLRSQNRLTFSKILQALEMAGKSMLEITPIIALAGIIVGSLTLTGLGINISSLLLKYSGGNLLILALLTGLACYVLGMGVAMIASYIILAILVAPAMVEAGVPVIVSHFFIFYIGTSMFITPPYAPSAFVAATIAESDPFSIGFESMKLAVVAFLVPFISIFNPALLAQGTSTEIALAFSTALIAVYALSVGLEGYYLTFLSWPERLLWLVGGFLLFIPSNCLIVPGLLLVAVGFFLQRWGKGKEQNMA